MKESNDISFPLWQLLNRTSHLMLKARQKELDQYGISIRSSAILEIISRLDKKTTPTAISQQTFVERHSISEQLARMEKEGLIIKARDLEMKNLVRVAATEKGQEVFKKTTLRKSIKQITSALSREEQKQLWSLLAKLRERTMKTLGIEDQEYFPPSDPDELSLTEIEDSASL